MMGPTHFVGGAALLAGVAVVTGTTAMFPLWAFGVAALSALVPDADQPTAMIDRPYFWPWKQAFRPIWQGAPHRGRTHSLVMTGVYGLLVAFWFGLLGVVSLALGKPVAIPWVVLLASALIGYASHLLLDMLNHNGVRLLWPLTNAWVFFPIFRFKADSVWADLFVLWPSVLFLGWYFIQNIGGIVSATMADRSLGSLLGFLIHAVVSLLGWFIGLAASLVNGA